MISKVLPLCNNINIITGFFRTLPDVRLLLWVEKEREIEVQVDVKACERELSQYQFQLRRKNILSEIRFQFVRGFVV